MSSTLSDVGQPALRLFAFAHAGASASIYGRFRELLRPGVEIVPVDLPGHGQRIREPLLEDPKLIVESVVEGIASTARTPFALFGHSLGAVIAFEVARVLVLRHELTPVALFASGAEAPCRRGRHRYERFDTDERILAEVRRLGGTPKEVLDDSELLQLTLPILRADFRACAAYEAAESARVPCPIHVLVGRDDELAPDAVQAWLVHSEFLCTFDRFDGGHFYVYQNLEGVTRLIEKYLLRDQEAFLGRSDASLSSSRFSP